MIWVLVGALILIGIIGTILGGVTSRDGWYWGTFLPLKTCGVVGIVTAIIVACSAMTNANRVAEMEAFYNNNTINYEETVNKTASYLSQEEYVNALVGGSVEKWEQAGYVSERIKEWRIAVNIYNTQLASYKYYDSNSFTSPLYPNKVQDMKFLLIK